MGLYTAGFLILNSYVGIIFNAMGTDYFPRLAAISEEIIKIRKAVFEQASNPGTKTISKAYVYIAFLVYLNIPLFSKGLSFW